jgi:FAD/FMN-containing dehydrogenase
MNEVSVSDGTVTVGAGARLADVHDALAAHDRTIAAGWRANRRDPQGATFTASQLVIGSQGT